MLLDLPTAIGESGDVIQDTVLRHLGILGEHLFDCIVIFGGASATLASCGDGDGGYEHITGRLSQMPTCYERNTSKGSLIV